MDCNTGGGRGETKKHSGFHMTTSHSLCLTGYPNITDKLGHLIACSSNHLPHDVDDLTACAGSTLLQSTAQQCDPHERASGKINITQQVSLVSFVNSHDVACRTTAEIRHLSKSLTR